MRLLDYRDEIISVSFLILNFGSVIVANHPWFACVARHGKILNESAESQSINRTPLIGGLISSFPTTYVPKSYFTHFYVFSTIISVGGAYRLETIALPNLMFMMHSLRRLWECINATKFSHSKMHVAGYVCGFAHYSLSYLCISMVPETKASQYSVLTCTSKLIGIVIFALANFYQSKCHKILFDNKSRHGSQYHLPQGSLFEYVCCPHYCMEIVIYFSFCLVCPRYWSPYFMLMWVVSNLSVVSSQQFSWYQQHYPQQVREKRLKRLVPFVW